MARPAHAPILEHPRRGRPARFAATALVGLLLAAPAVLGHAYWPTFYSAKSALSLSEKGLEAVVVIEVPTFQMVADFRRHYGDLDLVAEIKEGRFEALETAYHAQRFEVLAQGLRLRIDGAEAKGRWRAVDTPINGKGNEGFFVYMLEVVPPFEPAGDAVAVQLEFELFPDENVVMANVAEADDGWHIAESSIPPPAELPEIPEGAVIDPEAALWSVDPVKRDLRVRFVRDGS